MSAPHDPGPASRADLDAEVAQRLFGWRAAAETDPPGWWEHPEGAFRWHPQPPAYSTNPAATALVWHWVETRGAPASRMLFDYVVGADIQCVIQVGRDEVDAEGATWPEALCRAALALAEALGEDFR